MLVRTTTRLVATCVFLLLVAGALVTSTQSGLAVPDWPLSYGKLLPPMVGGILYEHGHRLVAAAVSTLVGVQILVLWLGKAPRRTFRLALLAFGAILCQALLGGLTVLLLLPPAVSSAHAGLAQVVFALAATIALRSSAAWETIEAAAPVPAALSGETARAHRLVLAATASAYVQILLGAVVRHTGAGLSIPDFPTTFGKVVPSLADLATPGVPIQLAHRLGAVVVSTLVVLAARSVFRLRGALPFVDRAATVWVVVLGVQVTLGAFSVWSGKAVPVTAAHLAGGALLWATGVLLSVTLGRLRRGADDPGPVRAAAPAGSLPA